MAPSTIKVSLFQHKNTGLLIGVSDDVPGFILHADTQEEFEEKLAPAFSAFMQALGETGAEYELVDQSTPGYWPPVFALQATHKVAV